MPAKAEIMKGREDHPSIPEQKKKGVAAPEPDAAEIERRRKEIEEAGKELPDAASQTLFGKKKPADEKKKDDGKAPVEPEDKKEDDKPPVQPEVKKPDETKPPVKKIAKPARQPEEIVEPAEEVLDEGLTPEDRRDLAVFQRMEQLMPDKYRGKSEEFKKFAKARYEYESKWIKSNPDKEFNPDDEEHKAFFDKQPQFEDDDFDEAKEDIRVERALHRQTEPLRRQQLVRNAINEAKPRIGKLVNDQIVGLVKAVSPELAKLLVDEKGNVNLSKESVAKVKEQDPIAGEQLDEIVTRELQPMLIELHKTTIPHLDFTLDPKDSVHKKIIDQLNAFEDVMKEAPEEIRVRAQDGVQKQFITHRALHQKTQAILSEKIPPAKQREKIDALYNRYWAADVSDIEAMIVDDLAEKAKTRIERLNKIGSKKFGKPGAKPNATEAEIASAAKPIPAKTEAKPKPPGAIGSTDVVVSTPPAQGGDKNLSESATGVLFRR